MAEDIASFIKAKKSKPFFVYYAPTLPHAALQAPREWVEKFPKEWDSAHYLGQNGYLPHDRPRAAYAAMIAYLDHTVGEIVKALDSAQVADRTLIVFTSDNGATFNGGVDREFFKSNGVLREGKMAVYEGGIRVPFVAKWPGRIRPGSVCHVPAACWDLMATVGEIVGVRTPKTDSVSYLPLLEGKPVKTRGPLYFEYPEAKSQQAVIWERFKVVWPSLRQNHERIEVFDLRSDPSESQNLASKRPDLIEEAKRIVQREHKPNRDFPLPGVDSRQP
jgi:arylsulfatase A-like enzyme